MKDRTMYPNDIMDSEGEHEGDCRLYILMDEDEFVTVEGPRYYHPAKYEGQPEGEHRTLEESHAAGLVIQPGDTEKVTGPTILMLGSTSKGNYFTKAPIHTVMADIEKQEEIHGRPLTFHEHVIVSNIQRLSRLIQLGKEIGASESDMMPKAFTANHLSKFVVWLDGYAPEADVYEEVDLLFTKRIEAADDTEKARQICREQAKKLVSGLNDNMEEAETFCMKYGIGLFGNYEGDPDGERLRRDAYGYRHLTGLTVLQSSEGN